MEQEQGRESTETKPRKPRTPKAERRVVVYRITDGKRTEVGSYPEATIGDPVERRLPTFLKEHCGPGQYKVDVRNKGQFVTSLDIDLTEGVDDESENIIDADDLLVESGDDDNFEELPFTDNHAGRMSAEVENVLLKERLRRLEEQKKQPAGPPAVDPATQSLIAALEQARTEQRELMLMMLAQAQKPAQDATAQAMSMLEKSFGMISKARDLSETIAPSGEGGGGSSVIADGAKLIDSLGRNAGTFLPILAGLMPKAATPSTTREAASPPAANNGSGEFTDLANKIQKKDPVTK